MHALPWLDRHSAPLLLILVLSACGGGGGGGAGGGSGGGAPTPKSPNLASVPGPAAIHNILTAGADASLSATDSTGNTYLLHVVRTPGTGLATFNSQAGASSTDQIVTITTNGVRTGSATSTSYYVASPFLPLGSQSSAGTNYIVVDSYTPPDGVLVVGSSSKALESATRYQDSRKLIPEASENLAYTVAARDSSTVLLCETFTVIAAPGNASGVSNSSEVDCYSVDANGSAALVSATITSASGTQTFK
jgi:hypothetical protein